MSDVVRNDIEDLVKKELESANKKFPLFRSAHEGYAVVLEELDETKHEYDLSESLLKQTWENIKENDKEYTLIAIKMVKEHAINLAVESIQVAAMAQKFIDSEEAREKK